MHRERLEKVLSHFKTVPEDRFDIESWSCGTTACLMGHAASLPEFQALGLGLEFVGRFDGMIRLVYTTADGLRYRSGEAVNQFLQIPLQDAHALFFPSGYDVIPSKQEVIDRIQHYLDTH